MSWRDRVLALDPCQDAREWIAALPAETTYEEAWAMCPRVDWLCWVIARCEPVRSSAPWSAARRPLVAAAAECARLALPAYEVRHPGDDRVRRCLDTTAKWARGEATAEEVRVARQGAVDADAYAYAAVAYVAYAACAACAVADGAYAVAAYTKCASLLGECAPIIRLHVPRPPELP